ncbi:MAG: hypothetical protein JWQ52_2127, partial [Phenylobacterium sp.]|nr:hypothetical protein [Phenylobacterium sp.]
MTPQPFTGPTYWTSPAPGLATPEARAGVQVRPLDRPPPPSASPKRRVTGPDTGATRLAGAASAAS